MIDASILLYSSYGGVLMRSKRIPAEEQYRLIMECRQSGLTDHQWCVEHDIKPGTFYNWVKRLKQNSCCDIHERKRLTDEYSDAIMYPFR